MLLKSTTRHVRIFTAEVVDKELQFHPNKLTLDLDPDNEFIWNEDSLNKIYEKKCESIQSEQNYKKEKDDQLLFLNVVIFQDEIIFRVTFDPWIMQQSKQRKFDIHKFKRLFEEFHSLSNYAHLQSVDRIFLTK